MRRAFPARRDEREIRASATEKGERRHCRFSPCRLAAWEIVRPVEGSSCFSARPAFRPEMWKLFHSFLWEPNRLLRSRGSTATTGHQSFAQNSMNPGTSLSCGRESWLRGERILHGCQAATDPDSSAPLVPRVSRVGWPAVAPASTIVGLVARGRDHCRTRSGRVPERLPGRFSLLAGSDRSLLPGGA